MWAMFNAESAHKEIGVFMISPVKTVSLEVIFVHSKHKNQRGQKTKHYKQIMTIA